MQIALKAYFNDLNTTLDLLKPAVVYNMDEVAIFFELSNDYTLEVKGTKIVGKWSSGKEKVRVTLIITAASTGHLLPPFLFFKCSKPRDKTFKDIPPKEDVTFKDDEMKKIIRRSQVSTCQNYTGWNNKRIMEKFYIPFYVKYTNPNSLLIFDNHGSHISDNTISILKENNIEHLPLAPNTTPICQPVDVGIGCVIKAKIKRYFEEWLIDKYDNDPEFIKKHPKKKNKYIFKSPDKALIIKWVVQAYEEIDKKTIIGSKL